ncbi:MAG: MalY/PatB family protein [Erysipelotrichales bacterium]
MKYDFDKIIKRKDTDCMKWDHMYMMDTRVKEDALPLWVADMEFEVAHEIVDAIKKRADHAIFGYTAPTKSYFDALTSWYKKRFDWDIDANTIAYAPGVVPAVGFIINAYSNEGDGIIIQPPVYYPFANTIKNNNRKIIENDLINDNGYYTIDFDDLRLKATDPNNKVMLFCTPHNPVGRVWTKEEVEQVIRICNETDTILVTDEIHCDLIRKNQKHYPTLSLAKDTSNIVACVAPSKTFNLAGLQMSAIIIEDEELMAKYMHVMKDQYAIGNFPPLSLEAVKAAYTYGESWLEQVIDYIDNNFKFIETYLNENLKDAKFWLPEGTYLAWLDLSAYGDTNKIQERLIEEENMLIENGNIFGESGQGYFRINVACPQSQLEDCLNRIKNVVQ